jgi:hypothetical protein
MKLNSVLTDYFCTQHKIDTNIDYKIEKIDAQHLLIPERIDLIAKLKYIEYREKGYDLTFIKELYTAHIEAFSYGSFTEPGSEEKNSIRRYFESFDNLIDNIKQNGINKNISVIPVGCNNAIMDGSHRVAIAAYFNLKVPIVRFSGISVNYNADFFKSRLLDERYIDFLVTEYCKIKGNNYFACIWPRAKFENKKQEVTQLINDTCKVVFEKKIKLNNSGLRNLMIQIYGHQGWIGSIDNHFAGVEQNVNECFDKEGLLTAYILESDSFEKILELKSNVREVFQVGNHSIHITDNYSETLQIANILLNNNSVDFLNRGKPDYYLTLNQKLNSLKFRLKEHNLTLEKFIIDSSSTLALYGLRDASDIDFMTISNNYELVEDDYICNHHDYVKLYKTTIDDLVLNPTNYFVYNDLKFVTLNVLRAFKSNRGEKKDQMDIILIDSVLKERRNIQYSIVKIKDWTRKKFRNFRYNFKGKLFNILKKLGIYKTIRNAYRTIKGISN